MCGGRDCGRDVSAGTQPNTCGLWFMGDMVVHTATSDKYLAFRFADTGLPVLHFDERLKNARTRFRTLKSAGLIGGHNPAIASSRLVKALTGREASGEEVESS